MKEIWKDVVGYEGLYEVSNKGQVRTKLGKTTYSKRHGKRVWKQRVMKQKVSKADGSHRVCLYKNKKATTYLVHRLVAESFIEKIEGKEYINHIDGNRHNNYAENLEWCNHKENNNHAFDNGLITSSHKVILIDLNTKEEHEFRSKSKASEFLGKNNGYISALSKKGKLFYKNYRILFNEAN
ncbi:NUMOD4 domain-containing protein [Pullulanibacillus sp. KACC 23026]|uniref:NUMOD4 domain-containing protein n=1 Tax=Pullulanibacillus sp. KACC 23026 TaxID=3028315 RepID=UPI0023B12A4B|nr:NUMOD4 domain-containing protein [Pullulanibacillus sp. KACC 23026]WEG13979.1 NUMOD4 domain-containing protein [Pullulanibacillus sp. KACC 23026]